MSQRHATPEQLMAETASTKGRGQPSADLVLLLLSDIDGASDLAAGAVDRDQKPGATVDPRPAATCSLGQQGSTILFRDEMGGWPP